MAVGEAAAAVTCHCFRDRIYDPSQPGKIDPYLLATTGNSFFAVAFGIPKKAVVKSKMSGNPGEDLWIAYFSAVKLNLRPVTLMASREKEGSWKKALQGWDTSLAPLGKPFRAALERDEGDGTLAAVAAGETLVALTGSSREEIDGMLSLGSSAQQIVAAVLFGRWSGRPAPGVLEEVKSGKSTWGSLLNATGITPDGMEARIRSLLQEGS
jgi:hypothetical protein